MRWLRAEDWSGFADLFTEDVHFVEYNVGVFNGREALRKFIVSVMALTPHARYPLEWVAFDEPNDAIVIGIRNVIGVDPADPSKEFWFPNISRLVYAGNHQFSLEEECVQPRARRSSDQRLGGGRWKARCRNLIDESGKATADGGHSARAPHCRARSCQGGTNTWNSNRLY